MSNQRLTAQTNRVAVSHRLGESVYISGWKAAIPSVLGWITAIAGTVSLLEYLIGNIIGGTVLHFLIETLHALNVPASSNLFVGIYLLLYSNLSFRRKRVAVWVAIGIDIFNLIADVAAISGAHRLGLLFYKYELLLALISIILALTTLVILIIALPAFPGKVVKGNWYKALGTLLIGLPAVFLFGLLAVSRLRLWENPYADTLWVLKRMLGRDLVFLFVDTPRVHGPYSLSVALGLLTALIAVISVQVFFSGHKQQPRSRAEDIAIRKMLARHPNDSLGYFATRGDRSLVMTPDGAAGISYGVSLGVAVAAGDPLGDPRRWDEAIALFIERCYSFGWVPAVIAASENGAAAYRRADMTVREMGDEAVIITKQFSASNPTFRALMRTVRKARRAGIEIAVDRSCELTKVAVEEVISACEVMRAGDERGFSMALDRAISAQDPEIVVVRARDEDGKLQAVLTFAPWGKRAISLNYMRRSVHAVNGVIEAMVVALIEYAQHAGIEKISLNFAMFRKVFVEGEAVGATVIQRLQARIMRAASKVWQLESLYASNARYNPEWMPRYFCVVTSPWLFQSFIASGVLEGFVPVPPRSRNRASVDFSGDPSYLAEINQINQEVISASLQRQVSQQSSVRMGKAQKLREAGMEPYPVGIALGNDIAQALAMPLATELIVRGRIRARRDHGKLFFIDLVDISGSIQIIATVDSTDSFELLRYSDIGDSVVVCGVRGVSRTGEQSIFAKSWKIAAKSLVPIAFARHARGHEVVSAGAANRTQELITNDDALVLLKKRFSAVAAIRQCLVERGFIEVETPMLHPVQGGANARPFVTHYTAYNADAFLRIAPELYLKRLVVAGMNAIFEIGRSFRNEGADATHNPEFTSLEAYQAGADYVQMRHLAIEIIRSAARAMHGSEVAYRPVGQGEPYDKIVSGVPMQIFDISGDWPVISVYDAVSRACGESVSPNTSVSDLRRLCEQNGVEIAVSYDSGMLIGALYEELVEAKTITPTFYCDFPVSTSPLTRKHRQDPHLAERWDLVAFGMELGTAYTELTDPIDQRERFTAQSLAAAAGDPEAMSIDYDFLASLENGLVPTGGLGLGVDRIVMALAGVNIRQTLAFPFIKEGTQK